MYKKEDVINLRNSNYEITEVDRKVYEEFGYVLHQASNNMVVYKPHFGSILGQRVITICSDGYYQVERWFINRAGEKDFDFLNPDQEEMKIITWKLDEMLENHSK